jgi:hypothetical protein
MTPLKDVVAKLTLDHSKFLPADYVHRLKLLLEVQAAFRKRISELGLDHLDPRGVIVSFVNPADFSHVKVVSRLRRMGASVWDMMPAEIKTVDMVFSGSPFLVMGEVLAMAQAQQEGRKRGHRFQIAEYWETHDRWEIE